MYRQDLFSPIFDLVSPDGKIASLKKKSPNSLEVEVHIEAIPRKFVGFGIQKEEVLFNLKSVLAQLGVESHLKNLGLDRQKLRAELQIDLIGLSPLGSSLLAELTVGAYIGKLFAADKSRRVREIYYLQRMFGRADRQGQPLLSFGRSEEDKELVIEKHEGRIIAFLPLLKERFCYTKGVEGFVPTVAKALHYPHLSLRQLLRLHQLPGGKRCVAPNESLLVRTYPLHVRTVFARVVNDYLPKGYRHAAADILQPDTLASGDIYEFYGESSEEIQEVPLEFYTLEPFREHVFFTDRDQLQHALENPHTLFKAFETAPLPKHHKCATFVVKGTQLLNLKPEDWISVDSEKSEFPGLSHLDKQAQLVQSYIEEQPSYPFLKAIEDDFITSQGILLTRFFPSTLMKRMLLSDHVQQHLRGIYFQHPSRAFGEFFSHEDRALLLDLVKFGIPVFWVDSKSQKLLQFIPRHDKDSGLFVPLDRIDEFVKATVIGIYGSNLKEGHFEEELRALLLGLEELKQECDHPLLSPQTPLALLTGGGPGAMSIGNKVAKELGILSCANIVDFTRKDAVVNEQRQNPYTEAKMTYRLDRLVERQAEFHLDLPIILPGGFGSDFELSIEEIRRKIGVSRITPVLLLGPKAYWKNKISYRFRQNLESGTIAGSEWVSNTFFVVHNAEEGLRVYKRYFAGQLPIGPEGPLFDEGFSEAPS